MKVWGEIPKILGIYENQKSVKKIEAASEIKSKKDVVSISSHAKDLQTVIKAIKDMPDIRQDKVSEISLRFKTGVYNVDGKETADKILKSVLDKKV
ncbi:FlgM family anti-sigma-28 factor [Anaerobacterium chartisolvens]|uniref:Negative regulator of flagellin synthesis n=1 Tax=Anaerobacterium chartisolvens TaxID=1297424 RepID=A0A369B0C3_9FIRM|nr:flagellar biosynthesis anti-sigma factor FlgM [Anaerobacterium chartisolvens]RCX14775.1 FlgM family anti-sigma-28 factor [Anaerobacterium chartisolvens]